MGFGVRPASALGQLAAAFLKRGLPQAVGFARVTETAREPSRSGSSRCHGILSLSDLDLIPSASRVTGSPGERPLRPSRTAAVAMTGIQCFQTIRVHHHEFLQGRGMTDISPVRQGSGAGEGGAPRGVLGCIVPLPFWLRHPWPRPLPVFNASGVTSSNLPLPPPPSPSPPLSLERTLWFLRALTANPGASRPLGALNSTTAARSLLPRKRWVHRAGNSGVGVIGPRFR